MEEGCLSLPGIHESVKRGSKIHVRYMDENFVEHNEVVEGFLARVMQHEFDHLDGKMFIDHISPLRKQMIKGKLNTMLKDFPTEYGYLLSSAALSACPKNTVIADMVIENILHRKSYRKISKERYIPMNPKDFYGYRRKTVAVLYERMRLLGVWEDK